MSGWQLSGDAPSAYAWITVKLMEPWTDDLIRAAGCRDGDRSSTSPAAPAWSPGA